MQEHWFKTQRRASSVLQDLLGEDSPPLVGGEESPF